MDDLTCIIVEDEPLAAGIIEGYIGHVPGLRFGGTYPDAFSASEALRLQKVDLLFVDINLPKVNGLDFIKGLNGRYPVIVTTAYHQYALNGFDLNVVDYLLKPISLSRFLQAVNKVFEKPGRSSAPHGVAVEEHPFFFFNVDKKQVKVVSDDILYVESIKDYVKIHTREKKIITHVGIGEMEKRLTNSSFRRIHKSFLVNINKVTAFNATEVEIGATVLPVGRTYKDSWRL